MRRVFLALVAIVAILTVVYLMQPSNVDDEISAQVVSTPVPIEGFTRADGTRTVEFPRDLGPHPDFRTEWWYYTGNLDTTDGRHFGYELTFFRVSMLPPDQAIPRASVWATNQVYMAHFALTNVAAEEFYAFQRYARGATELAGAQADPYRVWLEDWQVEQIGEGRFRLHAANEGLIIDLELADEKGPVRHGIDGYSQKGPEQSNASYYYSQTRLATTGTISINDQIFDVEGLSWKDHEYSTSVMSAGQVGWDWFAIQLDNEYELMLYQIRRDDGSTDPFSSGTLIAPNGETTPLSRENFVIETHDVWISPHSGAEYPVGWTVSLPDQSLVLELTPFLLDQELNISTIYWEGAVSISGTQDGQSVQGSGYVEMTGYAEPFNGDF